MTAVVVWISALIERRYSLACRALRLAIFPRRQSQGRAVPVRCEVKEIVVRIEKLRGVVPRARASAAGAKIAIRLDARIVAARDVVRHEIDDRFQFVGVKPLDQLLKFLQTFRRLLRVVRADIEVILDRIRATGEALQ